MKLLDDIVVGNVILNLTWGADTGDCRLGWRRGGFSALCVCGVLPPAAQ